MQRQGVALAPLLGLLDCMLPAALLAGLIAAGLGASFLQAGRWSLGALIFGGNGVIVGATAGAVAWASWRTTRGTNIVLGVLAGLVLGLSVGALLRSLHEPFTVLILRVPDPLLPALWNGLRSWTADAPQLTYRTALAAVFFSLVGYLSQKRQIQPEQPGEDRSLNHFDSAVLLTSSERCSSHHASA